ncbi:MAG: 3-deoxy-8-phosphooctulonate synthase [Planctomycetes bacterium]|nr:3-deoxy-8-phosphooctulonate synthase [Planctomycetota bacterium]
MRIKISDAIIGDSRLFLIAGPCIIENEKLTFQIAEALKNIASETRIPFIFKASYDKANRLSHRSYRGVGLKKGLEILAKVKKQLDIPVLSDVHCKEDVKQAAGVLDIIQIPALLCRQTDLLIAAGKTGKPVNIKKGQFLAPEDIIYLIEKVKSTGNNKIIITERGTSFGYHNLVNDMRAIPVMKAFGYPVIYDATHSAQIPGGAKGKSGGNRQMIPYLARAAVASGADGVFFEVYPQPDRALCDGPNSLALKDLPGLLSTLIQIKRTVS